MPIGRSRLPGVSTALDTNGERHCLPIVEKKRASATGLRSTRTLFRWMAKAIG